MPDLPPGLHDRIAAAARQWRAGVAVGEVRPLSGGASSLTYVAETDDAVHGRIVVKTVLPGLPAVRNRDLTRQALLIDALWRAGTVPVPELLFVDDGDDGPLLAMSFSAGEAFEPNVDEGAGLPSAAVVGERALDAARVLAAIHGSDPAQPWYGDEAPVTLAGEVERWARALATLPEDFELAWEPVADRLRATLPGQVPPVLTHGDFRLGNLLCSGGAVAAVVDWEIWARGDPRTDLGWFLFTLDPAHPAAVRRAPGTPSPDRLLATYAEAGGPWPADLRWFSGLARFKFAATTGLIAKHALRRGDARAWGVRMLPRLPSVLASAGRLVEVVR